MNKEDFFCNQHRESCWTKVSGFSVSFLKMKNRFSASFALVDMIIYIW